MRRFLPTKKRQRTPVADCDQYFLRKKGTKHPRHRHGFLATFDTKKYKVPRGRRPRLTADQKAANNTSRRLRSVLFAAKKYKVPRGRRPRLSSFRSKRECGGLKPASAGDGRILREHANIGEHPLFACSCVRPVKNRGLHCNWQLRAAGLASQARPVRSF